MESGESEGGQEHACFFSSGEESNDWVSLISLIDTLLLSEKAYNIGEGLHKLLATSGAHKECLSLKANVTNGGHA